MEEDLYKCYNCRFFNKKWHECDYWEPGCAQDNDEDDFEPVDDVNYSDGGEDE